MCWLSLVLGLLSKQVCGREGQGQEESGGGGL